MTATSTADTASRSRPAGADDGPILLEAALAFLGVGTQPPAASWGAMLADSRSYLSDAWWYGLFPGVAIALLVLAVNLLADAVRDALDPRSETDR